MSDQDKLTPQRHIGGRLPSPWQPWQWQLDEINIDVLSIINPDLERLFDGINRYLKILKVTLGANPPKPLSVEYAAEVKRSNPDLIEAPDFITWGSAGKDKVIFPDLPAYGHAPYPQSLSKEIDLDGSTIKEALRSRTSLDSELMMLREFTEGPESDRVRSDLTQFGNARIDAVHTVVTEVVKLNQSMKSWNTKYRFADGMDLRATRALYEADHLPFPAFLDPADWSTIIAAIENSLSLIRKKVENVRDTANKAKLTVEKATPNWRQADDRARKRHDDVPDPTEVNRRLSEEAARNEAANERIGELGLQDSWAEKWISASPKLMAALSNLKDPDFTDVKIRFNRYRNRLFKSKQLSSSSEAQVASLVEDVASHLYPKPQERAAFIASVINEVNAKNNTKIQLPTREPALHLHENSM